MNAVVWPEAHAPPAAAVHVRNAAQATATPEQIWPWLVRPDRWREYYSNARFIRHLSGPWPDLALGSRFRWLTFGLLITSVVTECEPHRRLSWSWRGLGAEGHHGFVLEPREWGTLIVTEETVRGPVAHLLHPLIRPVMLHFHQQWVEGLAEKGARRPGR